MKNLFVSLRRVNGDSYAELKIPHLPRQLDCENTFSVYEKTGKYNAYIYINKNVLK